MVSGQCRVVSAQRSAVSVTTWEWLQLTTLLFASFTCLSLVSLGLCDHPTSVPHSSWQTPRFLSTSNAVYKTQRRRPSDWLVASSIIAPLFVCLSVCPYVCIWYSKQKRKSISEAISTKLVQYAYLISPHEDATPRHFRVCGLYSRAFWTQWTTDKIVFGKQNYRLHVMKLW